MCSKRRLQSACASAQFYQYSLFAWRNFASLAIQDAPRENYDQTQQTHNVTTTSLQRRCNVTTLQRRCNDIVRTLCVCWRLRESACWFEASLGARLACRRYVFFFYITVQSVLGFTRKFLPNAHWICCSAYEEELTSKFGESYEWTIVKNRIEYTEAEKEQLSWSFQIKSCLRVYMKWIDSDHWSGSLIRASCTKYRIYPKYSTCFS